MKKSIFLFFAAILCAIGMNAAIPSKLYLDASDWGYADARYAAYFMPQNSFVDMTKATGEVSVFEVAVPASQTKVIFVRMNGATTENNWNNGTKWNQTGDLTIPTDGKNKFKPSGWDGATTTWSTYTYTPPTFYIAGDFVTPTWSENAAANKMDYADGVFSKSYDNVAASPHQFKITNGTWTNAIGYNQNTCSGTNCKVEGNGENIQFTPLAEGTVTITYTLADGKVHITCPEPPAAEFNITYPATQTNYTLVAGPAKAQTGAEVSFTATPVEGYVLNVTYNGNVIAGENNVYTFMMPAADVTIAITAVAATTLYYVDHNNWGNVNAYMWSDNGNNGSWPGAAMALVGTVGDNAYSYYSISFAQGAYTSIIFNGGGSQTDDLTIDPAKPYFYDGAWYTWDELLAKLAAPVVTYDYYITGSFNGNDPKKAENGMTLDGEVYKATVTLAAGDNTLKVTKGSWDPTWGYSNLGAAYEEVFDAGEYNNIKITLTAEKSITVIFDATAGKITFDGLTEKEVVKYDYYIAGTLPGAAWNPTSLGMTKEGDAYKATFTELNAGIYEFKITAGDWDHQWNYNNLGAAYEEVSQGVDGEGKPNGNIKIVTEEAKTITVIFDATAGEITLDGLTPYVAPLTYTVTVPAGTEKCYIAGSMNGWAFQEMEAVTGETNKFTITIIGAKETDEYKYACQADWAYAEVIDGGGNRTQWTALDNVTAWNKPAVITYQLKGVGGWDVAGIEMTENPDKAGEYMLTCQAISATDAIKVVRLENGEIKDYYGNGTVKDGVEVTVNYDVDGNITLAEGTYNFYFDTNETEKKLWIAAATDCEAGEEIGDILDLTMTNLVVTPNGTFDLLEASENEYGISVTLGVDTDGDLIEGSNVTMNGETELPINYDLSGKFTKSTDAENGDVYSGLVVVEFDGGLMGLQLTMYASTIEVTEVNLTGGTVTLNDFGAYVMSAKWDTEDVIVELTALEMEDWVSIAIGEDQILSGMATVTNQDGVVTLEAKGLEEYNEEWTQVIAIYDITITATLDLQNVTVYFINTPKWNTPIYAYATKKTGWGRYQEVIAENAPSPGEEATKEDYQIAGYDVYSYTALEGTYNSVQFSGGSEATDDAGWESDMYYIHDFDGNSGWYTRTDAEALLTPDPEPDPDPTPDPEVTEITLTEGDNSSALATEGVVTVTVERVFEKDSLYTIALPFTINNAASVFGYGTVVYNFANLAYDKTNEEYILGFTTVNKIEAGKPYLIQPGQNVNEFVAENVTLSPATSISQKVTVDEVEKIATMTAVLSETTTGGSYWLAENRFLYNGTVNMPALRALFVLPTTPSGMPARARVALKEDAATGVEDLFTTEAPVKVIVNGQLIIIRDGVKYNVQGQVIR